jgi:hypothetical protein
VIDGILREQAPMRERAQPYLDDPTLVREIIADGNEQGAPPGPGNDARRASGDGAGLLTERRNTALPTAMSDSAIIEQA